MTAARTLLWAAVAAVASCALAAWGLGADPGPAYRVEAVTRGDLSEVVLATGTINPQHVVDVGTQVSGQVNKLLVQVNDQVAAGQVLAEIDPALLLAQIRQDRTALETARANFEQAGRDLDRAKALHAKDYIAKVDVERSQQSHLAARNNLQLAQTALERDELNLGYATIRSPIDGVVIACEVAQGQTLQASFQTPKMFRIAGSLRDMKIDVSLSEADVGKVKIGMPVTFTVTAYPDRPFTGVVKSTSLSPVPSQQAASNAASYAVTVAVDNGGGELLPGMTAYVSVTLSKHENVLRLPLAALRFVPAAQPVVGLKGLFSPAAKVPQPRRGAGPTGQAVYALRDGVPVRVPVQVGPSDDAFAAVSGPGLVEGDRVVVGVQRPSKER